MIELIQLGTVGSTNDEAWARAMGSDAPRPLAVRADAQTDGRGRRGRAWASPPGGVWLSVAWPCAHPPDHYGAVSVLAVLAVLDTLLFHVEPGEADEAATRLRVKWPNDLLVDDRKLAGILCERKPVRDGCDWLITGVGVNETNPLIDRDEGAIEATGYRDALGLGVGAQVIAEGIVDRLERALRSMESDPQQATEHTRTRLEKHLAWGGERVRVTGVGDDDLVARIVGIDSALCLQLIDDRDTPHQIRAGQIERVRLAGGEARGKA